MLIEIKISSIDSASKIYLLDCKHYLLNYEYLQADANIYIYIYKLSCSWLIISLLSHLRILVANDMHNS